MSEETWVADLPESKFLENLSPLPGQTGLHLLNLQEIFEFQKRFLVLRDGDMAKIPELISSAKTRGYLDFNEAANLLDRTVMVVEGDNQGILFFAPGPSNNSRENTIFVPKSDLQALVRAIVRDDADDHTVVNGWKTWALNEDYRLVDLSERGFNSMRVAVPLRDGSQDEDLDEYLNQLGEVSQLGDLFKLSTSRKQVLPLLDYSKKRFAFVTHREDWFVDLPYLVALDLFTTMKDLYQVRT